MENHSIYIRTVSSYHVFSSLPKYCFEVTGLWVIWVKQYVPYTWSTSQDRIKFIKTSLGLIVQYIYCVENPRKKQIRGFRNGVIHSYHTWDNGRVRFLLRSFSLLKSISTILYYLWLVFKSGLYLGAGYDCKCVVDKNVLRRFSN